MKPISVLLFVVFFFFIQEKNVAQTTTVSSGVYLTAKDFKKNKLIEEADCTNDKERFERHDIFSRPIFVVIHKGKKLTYQKNDIYAYRDCENRVWRFYNNKEYQVVETKDIFIYKVQKVVMDGGTIEKEPFYYFSDGPEGEIKELTIDNLKIVFSQNLIFLNMVNIELNSENAINSYDLEHKMYKVNYIFKQSKK